MVKKNSPAKGWLFGGFSAAIATKGKSYGQKNCKFAAIWAVIICYKQKLREEKTVLCQAEFYGRLYFNLKLSANICRPAVDKPA